MKNFIWLLILISFTSLEAQTYVLKGKVINEKASPIIGASILIVGTQTGTSADESGFFEINNLPSKTMSIQVTSVGYQKYLSGLLEIKSSELFITIVLKEDAIQTNQIIVSAGKYKQDVKDITVSTSVLPADIITEKNYITFDDLLRYVPGVQMNLEQPSIRGSSGYSKGAGARVLVALNGLPLYSGDNGDIVWEMIPVMDIERVEIIKGPASSLYGSSAIGGVINIITKQAAKNPVTNFRTYYGLYDKPAHELWNWSNEYRQFYGAEFSHSNSYKNIGYTVALKKYDSDSYRQNDFYKRYLAYGKLIYNFSNESYLTLLTNYLYMNRGNFLYWKDSRNALVPKDEDNGNTVESNRLFTGLIFNHTFNNNFTAEFKGSYYRTKFSGYGLEVTTSTANLARGEALTNYKITDSFVLTSGAEISFASISSNIFKNPTFWGVGLYAQTELKLSSDLLANIGLRYDFMKLDTISGKNAVTPRAGLNYKLTSNLILRASLGTGFRAPTPAEVFTSTAVGGGVSVKENPNLTYETSLSFEIGSNYSIMPNLNFDLAFYQTEYNNFIEPNLLRDGSIQFLNLTKARIQGLEIVCDWKIIPGEVSLNAGYNYMWSRDIENKRSMKYRPRNIVYAQMKYSPDSFDFGIDFRYMSEVEEIDWALAEPPLALVVDGNKKIHVYTTDIMAGYNFLLAGTPAKAFINIKNIFNYNYVEFIGNIAPIRNYSLSFEIFF